MARIPTYQKDTHISDLDRIIGTDGDTNELVTKNFFLGDIAEYVIDKFIDPDAVSFTIPLLRDTQDVPGSNATRITGSIISQDTYPTGTKISITGDLEVDGGLDVAGIVRLGFTGNDPVILGDPNGKRTEWNNPGYLEIYAENPFSPGDFNETVDIDGEYYGGGFVGVYPANTEDAHGVRMHVITDPSSAPWGSGFTSYFHNFIDIAKANRPSQGANEQNIRISDIYSVRTTGEVEDYAGIKISHPTDNRFRFNSEFNTEPTVPFLVNSSSKFTGQVTIPEIPVAVTDAASKSYVDAGDVESKFAITLRQPARFQVAVQPGDPVYITGYNPGQERYEVDLAQAGDPARMPAIGIAADTYGANDNGYIITHGAATGINTNAFNVGDTVWVAQGGGLTNTRPSGANLVQNVGVVGKKSGGAGEIEAIALGRTNDVPNIPRGSMWVGDAAGVANPLPIGTAGQILVSDGTDVNWEDRGSGTTNTVPLWSDGPNGVLADSILSQDTNPPITDNLNSGLVSAGDRVKTDGTLGVTDSLIVNYTDDTYPRVFPPYNPTGDFNTQPTGRIGVVNDVNTLEWAFSAVSIGGLAPSEYSNRSGLLHRSGGGYRLLLSNATERTVLIDSDGDCFINSGNLAIGHDTPTEKLDVLGDIKATNVRTERVRPQQGGTVVKINQANFFSTGNISNVSNADIGATLHLRTNEPLTDQDVIALTKGGLGTGFPSGIKQSAGGEYTFLLRDNSNSQSIKLASNKPTPSFIDNGKVFLGGNTDQQDGAVTINNRRWTNGVKNAVIQFNKSGTQLDTALEFKQGSILKGSISYDSTGTNYNVTSDYRVKENVVEITDGIERLKQLKPSKFNFITDTEKVVDGFIAHEVQDVVPEAVTGDKDATEEYEVTPAEYDDYGNLITEAVMGTRDAYQQIDQAKIVPLLTAALQEAITKIETLEAKVNALEGN